MTTHWPHIPYDSANYSQEAGTDNHPRHRVEDETVRVNAAGKLAKRSFPFSTQSGTNTEINVKKPYEKIMNALGSPGKQLNQFSFIPKCFNPTPHLRTENIHVLVLNTYAHILALLPSSGRVYIPSLGTQNGFLTALKNIG